MRGEEFAPGIDPGASPARYPAHLRFPRPPVTAVTSKGVPWWRSPQWEGLGRVWVRADSSNFPLGRVSVKAPGLVLFLSFPVSLLCVFLRHFLFL